MRLDLNLEKGRIREEANGQEMRIKETETRIEQEVAGLRERVEAVKFSTLQWLMYVYGYGSFSSLGFANFVHQGCLYRYRGFDSGCLAPSYVSWSCAAGQVSDIYPFVNMSLPSLEFPCRLACIHQAGVM